MRAVANFAEIRFELNIPPKRNRKEVICFSPYLYRARNLVERFFNRIGPELTFEFAVDKVCS